MDIISRAEWGARQPRSVNTTTWSRRTEFIVHYSGASPNQTVRSIQDYCMDTKGYSDIDYNALVDTAGRIYEGRTGIWLTIGSHCLNHNTSGIGVCYIGDNSTPLTEAAKTAIRWLYDEANRRKAAAGYSTPLAPGPHSTYVQTSCPGDQLRGWIAAGMPASGDDMLEYGNFGPSQGIAGRPQGVLLDDVWGTLMLGKSPYDNQRYGILKDLDRIEAELVAVRTVVEQLAEAIKAGGGSVDTAAILRGVDERLAAHRAAIEADTRDAVADLGEGGAAQVRADVLDG